MKPAAFDYIAAHNIDEALEALAQHGEDAKLLAGGQSLGPLLNLRLAAPVVLVDLNRVPDLSFIRRVDGTLAVGAMTRQRALELSPEAAESSAMIVDAVQMIAHPTIRNRGTVGGSVAHGDPAAELPVVAAALEAQMIVRSARGERSIAAREFFTTYFTTALEPDEILVEVRFPTGGARAGGAWAEFAPRRGDYFLVGVAATVRVDDDNRIHAARLTIGGITDTPVTAPDEALEGTIGESASNVAALERVAAGIVRHLNSRAAASSPYKKRLIGHLAARALAEAGRRAAAA